MAGGLNPSSVTPFINIGHTQSLHPLQPQVHTINTHSTCLTHIQSPFQPNTHSHSTHLHCPPKGPPPTHNFHTKLILYYTPKTLNTRAQPTQTHDSYTSHTTHPTCTNNTHPTHPHLQGGLPHSTRTGRCPMAYIPPDHGSPTQPPFPNCVSTVGGGSGGTLHE